MKKTSNVKRCTTADLTKGLRAWCWWLHRYIWYTGYTITRADGLNYKFIDAGDCRIEIKAEDIEKLQILRK